LGKPFEGLSFKRLFEAAADALLLTDDAGRVVLSNAAAQRMLGYGEGKLIGMAIESLMPVRSRADHERHRREYSKQPEQRPMGGGMELVALRRDGSELPVQISLSPMPTAKVSFVLVNLHDITERKAYEQRLAEQRVLMESLFKHQLAAQTAAAIAHEMNQPLAAISAYGEVALHALDSGDLDSKSLHAAIEGCVRQSQRAGQTLHELLEFLQHDEAINKEPLDINDLIREALAITQNEGFGGFHPQLRLRPDLPPVLVNRLHIQKVLLNLLRNGVEAMRGAGVPDAAIIISVQTLAERKAALVTVQDNGPGMSAETAQRIFDTFFTTKVSGIGMGLAISRALVEANGGQLWVDPDSPSGATFHFTLPFAPQAPS
jgi:PAS domain S-box-containing protein